MTKASKLVWISALCTGGCYDTRPPTETVTVAWIDNDGSSPFFTPSIVGANLAAKDLTATGHPVNVTIMNPQDSSASEQKRQIDDAIAANVDAIDLDVTDAVAIGPEIAKATAAGIKVLTFDSDADSSGRLTYYGIDNNQAGHTAAQLLAKAMGGTGGKIAIMVKEYPITSANYAARVKGFTDELAANLSGFTVAVTLPCTDTGVAESVTQKGCTVGLEKTTADYPDVTGWYLARGRALREADLATEAPNWSDKMLSGALHTVAFDAIPASNPQIKAGFANAVINQNYYGWGYDVVNLSYQVVATGRTLPAFSDSQFAVVCANNIDQLINDWASSDFRRPLTVCSLLQ
jgi:ribose transport system substrate-binding protein